MVNSDIKQLHFIVGIGRSGTTILNKILNSHPDILSLPEANFLAFFLNDYKNVKQFNRKHVDLIFEEIALFSLSHPFLGYEFDIESAKNKIIHLVGEKELSYEALCKSIYSEFKVIGNDKLFAKILIDKNPSYTLFVDKIAAQFPNSKFIFLVRDYRANTLSKKQSVYLETPNVAYNAYRWKLFNENALSFCEKNNDRVLLLRYEDLVVNNLTEIERICDFLGVRSQDINTQSGEEIKISFSNYNISPKYEERFNKKYSDLNRPLNTGRLNSWETQFSPSEIKICDTLCSDIASQVGYKSFFQLSWIEKLSIRLKHSYSILRAFINVNKDYVIYYMPVEMKLKRLKKIYSKLGFINKQ